MKVSYVAAAAGLMVASCVSQGIQEEAKESLVVNVAEKGAEISPGLYGIFFEEINHSGDGGLLAELVENGSFEDLEMPEGYHAEGDLLVTPFHYHHSRGEMVRNSYRWTTDPVPGWTLEGAASMALSKESPMFETAPTSLNVNVDGSAVLKNDGYWGMNLEQGKNYELRVIARPCKGSSVSVRLLSESGSVLAETPLQMPAEGEWNDVRAVLCPDSTSVAGSLALVIEGAGTVSLDFVSLMPEDRYSYAGGKLPLRKDVAECLAGLRPAFVRWPGGCVVEGISLENRYEWKKSLGDIAARSGEYDTWGYHCTYGFGYHEMLCFCESVGAKAMFVCNVGIGCQYRQGDLSSEEDIQFYIDDCMDAIEYALGPADSEWGALRAQAGHPEPLPLKYVEIGNENWGADYEKRYNMFHKAIKEKYPELVLISNCKMDGIGAIEKTDMVDPHWYVEPEFFFNNTHLFDEAERGRYDVYVGEYAANTNVGSGNMRAALSEAAWIGGMERNGDLVKMASYAPLLENANDRVWPVNLISVNSHQVLGRSSYYVQKMAAENRPDWNVACSVCETGTRPLDFKAGRISLGTNETATEFKDVTVTTGDGVAHPVDLSAFDAKKGSWSYAGGILRQSSLEEAALCTFDGKYEGSYSISLKFRRIKGAEGCYLGFAMSDDAMDGFRCSVAGWDDTRNSVEEVSGNSAKRECASSESKVIRDGEWQEARVDIADNRCTLSIDGKTAAEYQRVSQPAAYYAAGYDSRHSETVIKIVNRGGEALPLAVTLEGARRVSRRGTVITLAADSDDDENTFDDTTKISPVESTWDGFGKDFVYTLKPYSYTVLRVKTRGVSK